MFINAFNASRAVVGLLALTLAAACGSSSSTAPSTTSATMSPSNSATVTIPPPGTYANGMFAFAPGSVTINAGGTVTWKNNDSVTHTSTSDSPGWDLTITSGGSVTQTFPTAGTFPYHCRLHSMTGTVIVQ
jgi:plastocyanin